MLRPHIRCAVAAVAASTVMAGGLGLSLASPARAAGLDSTSTTFTLGSPVSGQLTQDTDEVDYRFLTSAAGRVTFTFKSTELDGADLALYDEDGDKLWSHTYDGDDTSQATVGYTGSVDLNKGDYYFVVGNNYSDGWSGSYTLTSSFVSAGESFTEPEGGSDNATTTADQIVLGTRYTGLLAENDDEDVYAFTTSGAGRVNFTFKSTQLGYADLYLYDADGTKLWYNFYDSDITSEATAGFANAFDLNKGEYYFAVVGNDSTGAYTLSSSFVSAGESFAEPEGGDNNVTTAADAITVGSSYVGMLGWNDDEDVYRFDISAGRRLNLSFKSAQLGDAELDLYDRTGGQVWHENYYADRLSATAGYTTALDLKAGTYYFAVSESSDTGSYRFSFGGSASPVPPAKTVKVTFNTNGGKLASGSRVKTLRAGSALGALPKVKRAHRRFQGWFTGRNAGSRVSASTVVRASMTLFAHWSKK